MAPHHRDDPSYYGIRPRRQHRDDPSYYGISPEQQHREDPSYYGISPEQQHREDPSYYGISPEQHRSPRTPPGTYPVAHASGGYPVSGMHFQGFYPATQPYTYAPQFQYTQQYYPAYPQLDYTARPYAPEARRGQFYNTGSRIPQHCNNNPDSGGELQHEGPSAYGVDACGGEQPPSYDAVSAETQPGRLSATEEDARKHGIKPGYNLEHWDPREAPFVLCGSVYDANSLGKAIFDTTVAVCGDKTDPVAKAAGELWLLLIHFAGCYKRAMEALDMVQNPLEMGKIETYIHYGFGEMKKLDKLLQECDEITRRALEEGESGMELVKNLFSHSRVSELTGRSMQSLRSWQSGFDAICEPILKKHGKELNLPGRDAQDANSTR